MSYAQELAGSSLLPFYMEEMARLLTELGASVKARALHQNPYYKEIYTHAKSLMEKIGESVSREEIENVRDAIYDADNVISSYLAQQAFVAAYGTYFGARLPHGNLKDLLNFKPDFIQHPAGYRRLKEKRDSAVEQFCSKYPGSTAQHFRSYCRVLAELAELDRVYDFCAGYELGIAMLKQYRPDFERDNVFEAELDKAIEVYLCKRPAPSSLV